MNSIVFPWTRSHHRHQPQWLPCQCIAAGLLVALLGTLHTPVTAQPSIAQTPAPASTSSPTNTVAEQLLGQWQTQDPASGEKLMFIFAPEDTLFVVLPAPDGTSVALKVEYQINPTTQPMQLDIQLNPQENFATIFEFTPSGQLRLELEGLNPGQPRPTAFRPNTVVFEKTSQATTVPETIQVIESATPENLNPQDAAQPQDEAKNYMYALAMVQQAHYREVGQFATTIEDVSIGLRTETESYRYRIIPQGNEKQSVMITAVAKTAQLPSYTGAVFVTQVNGETTTVAQICETEQPSTSPPAMPVAPTSGAATIQCPIGSRALLTSSHH